jgi:hypothetical protein
VSWPRRPLRTPGCSSASLVTRDSPWGAHILPSWFSGCLPVAYRFTSHTLLDSRFRGNDPPEADRGSGCPRYFQFFLSPMSGGFQGVEYSAINRSRKNVTERCRRVLCQGIVVSAHHGQASLRPRHPSKVCRGAKPLCRDFEGVPQLSFSFPQEWRPEGQEERVLVGYAFAQPTLHKDSRLRANDTGRSVPCSCLNSVQRLVSAGGLGVSPILFCFPP